jgi:asparagine synthase (glutamine-hydrolysing)
MCGIAGWYRRFGRRVPEAAVVAQCDAIRHRGPDDSGVFADGDFGFGMRRLSILDLAGGHQPMALPERSLVLVFNGEIYNHLELRAELADQGHSFRTHSDTETILVGFACWGNRVWAKLEGMFTAAVWDREKRELVLARDPLGIKPLYLTQQRSGLAFASELKALLVLPEHEFAVDDRAVHDYFSFGHVRRPRSIYRQVRTLDPGHFLTLRADGDCEVTAFWEPRFQQVARPDVHWFKQMQEMLQSTTARHMQSDVPVGAFLSGGIDSSAVLAAMRRSSNLPIKAFTIGYPGAAIDETVAARSIAQHLNCEHIVLPLELGAARDVLPEVLHCYDEPFADMAAAPTWFASKLASEHVKVVLCGEGGDELFAGYKRHRNAENIRRFRPLLDAAGPLAAVLERMPLTSSTSMNYLRQHGRRLAEFMELPDGYQQFFAATQISRRRMRHEIYTPELLSQFGSAESYADLEREYFSGGAMRGLSPLNQFLMADLTVNMPSAMLTRLDRASMAHSVEARVPFLSHKLVDWALTVPESLKLRGNVGKFILRKAVAPWLPSGIVKRPKQGFQMPLAAWMRGDFGRYAREVWSGSGAATAGYLDAAAVDRLFEEHESGAADHGRMLYAITAFGLWWQHSRWKATDVKAMSVDC